MEKSVHRVIELPATCGRVYSHSVGNCECWAKQPEDEVTQEHPQTHYMELKPQPNKYKHPKLNTILRHVQEAEAMERQTQLALKKADLEQLTPRSKAIVAPKITKKLNFRPDQTVYKNLTPLNVNDSVLLPEKMPSIRNKYVKSKQKIVEPELRDFLEPLPPLTHIVPEPEITLRFPTREFDYFGSFLRLHE